MNKKTVLKKLVEMSARIARPELEYLHLSEGNTSAKIDDQTLYIKRSGAYLCRAKPSMFVEVLIPEALKVLEHPTLTFEEIKEHLSASRVNKSDHQPSIETIFHSYLLSLPGIDFVAHTHPTALNIILFSNAAREIMNMPQCDSELLPDPSQPLFIDCPTPGLQLAHLIKNEVEQYIDRTGRMPGTIFIKDHGMIAAGKTPDKVETLTMQWVKMAKILYGAYLINKHSNS